MAPPQVAPLPVDLMRRGTLVPPSVQIVATTTLTGSTLGIPIMREGFVTETGLLPSASADQLWPPPRADSARHT